MPNFCKKCGSGMTVDLLFCTECGTEMLPAISEPTYLASKRVIVSPSWATVYSVVGVASIVLAFLTPILFAVLGTFLGTATRGYSVEGGVISFGIGVIGGAMIFGSGMILMAFGQSLKLELSGDSSVDPSKYKYTGFILLFLSAIPFTACAAACLWLAWQTESDLDGLSGVVASLLLLVGFVPSAVLYAGGRTLMACEHLLNFRLNGRVQVDPARYRGLGILALIFGAATPIITIASSVTAVVISSFGMIVGIVLLTLGYGIIPGAMLFVAGVILLACEQVLKQLINGESAGETIKYKAIGFAAIVLGVIVPITTLAKGFAAILATIGAGGLIPALPPLYLGFVGCPVLIIGGISLIAADNLLRTKQVAETVS